MTFGVDPGSPTGLSLVDKGSVIHHATPISKLVMKRIDLIHHEFKFKRAVVELPRYGVLYDRPWLKKATNIYQQAKAMSAKSGAISVDQYKELTGGSGARDTTAGQIRLAQNIGQNIQLTKSIVDFIEQLGVEVKQVHPKNGQSKWSIDHWKQVFSWPEERRPPSNHSRDAAILASMGENTWEIL